MVCQKHQINPQVYHVFQINICLECLPIAIPFAKTDQILIVIELF